MPPKADPAKKVTLTCPYCEQTFKVYRSRPTLYCSRKCHDADNAKRCTTCGGTNTRGGSSRICENCLPQSKSALAHQRAKQRLAGCPAGQRWCSYCDRYLVAELFTSKEHCCSACQATRNRSGHLRRMGITDEQYRRVLFAQGGRCAICCNKPRSKQLHADHDHLTGAFRGLLCSWCNHRLLGGARESVEILQRAIDYLKDPPAAREVGLVIIENRTRKRRSKRRRPRPDDSRLADVGEQIIKQGRRS